MRILFDHCVLKPFRRALAPTHEIRTTAQMGLDALENGKLLAAAAAEPFDVFLTVDKNIKARQNLSALPLPVVVLDSPRVTPDALAPSGLTSSGCCRRGGRGIRWK